MQKIHGNSFAKPAIMLALLALLTGACNSKKAPEHAKLIPKEYPIVVKLDAKQLTSKTISLDKLASKENLQKMGASEKDAENASKNIKKFLDSGVDFLNNFYLFFNADKSEAMGLTFALDNESKFSKFIQNDALWTEANQTKKPTFKQEGDIKFAIFQDKDNIIAWKGKTAVLLSKPNNSTAELKKLFEMKESEMLVSNENFKDFLSKKYDASIWMDIEKLSALGDNQAALAMNVAGFDNKNTYTTLGFTFDKGKVLVDTDYTGNENIAKFYEKISNSNIRSELAKNIPIADPTTGFSFSMNWEGVLNFLKERGLENELNKNLKELGLTSKDLEVLTGDALGASQKIDFNATSGKIPVDFVIALGIKNKKSFEDLIGKINQQGNLLKKEGDVYTALMGLGYLIVKDQAVYITLNENLKEGIKAGKGQLKGTLKDNAEKYASVIYFGKGFFDAFTSSETYKKEAGSLTGQNFPFENILLTIEKVKNKQIHSQFTVNMTDKNTNSLLTLIEFSKKISEEQEKQRKKLQDEFEIEKPEDETVLEEE